MNLRLAIATSCTDLGCQVQFLDSDEWHEAAYSKPVLRRKIAVHCGDLVAVDLQGDALRVVYRVVLGTVVGMEEGDIFADTPSGVHQLGWAEGVEGPIKVGSQVFLDQGTILAVCEGGRPTNPGHLRATLFPEIRALYATLVEEASESVTQPSRCRAPWKTPGEAGSPPHAGQEPIAGLLRVFAIARQFLLQRAVLQCGAEAISPSANAAGMSAHGDPSRNGPATIHTMAPR